MTSALKMEEVCLSETLICAYRHVSTHRETLTPHKEVAVRGSLQMLPAEQNE
jgi:hypothetical protein